MVLQSFSYGKPVIASNLGGLNDLIENGTNGLLFEAGNVDNLAKKIESLFHNDQLIQEMGKNSRSFLEDIHNPEKYYNRTMNIFESLIR